MAHALDSYKGLCSNIHGHSYVFEVTVTGKIITDSNNSNYGMILDFKDLKQIVEEAVIKKFDHYLVLSNKTDANLLDNLKKNYDNITVLDYQPTNENMINDFANRIMKQLPTDIELVKLRLYETKSSYAEWLK
jgi:6-pyruvoyltetrahydropterin/6-carboxytetrahydropterin synthase